MTEKPFWCPGLERCPLLEASRKNDDYQCKICRMSAGNIKIYGASILAFLFYLIIIDIAVYI